MLHFPLVATNPGAKWCPGVSEPGAERPLSYHRWAELWCEEGLRDPVAPEQELLAEGEAGFLRSGLYGAPASKGTACSPAPAGPWPRHLYLRLHLRPHLHLHLCQAPPSRAAEIRAWCHPAGMCPVCPSSPTFRVSRLGDGLKGGTPAMCGWKIAR